MIDIFCFSFTMWTPEFGTLILYSFDFFYLVIRAFFERLFRANPKVLLIIILDGNLFGEQSVGGRGTNRRDT